MKRYALGLLTLAVSAAVLPATAHGQSADQDLTDAVITVTPSADLVDLQTVDVVAENFDPIASTLYLAQCASGVVGTVSISDCDISSFSTAFVDDTGRAEAAVRMRREINTSAGVVDCAGVDACVLGAATLESDLVTVIEGAVSPIAFDPTVPPTPRLEIDVEVLSSSASSFSVSITCNREAQAYVDGNLSQTVGNRTSSSYGYNNGELTCGPEAVERSVPLAPGTGRFRPGDAVLDVFVSAFDGAESAFVSEQVEILLRGNSNKVEPISVPGTFLSVEIVGHTGSGEGQFIDVEVSCSTPFDDVTVALDVSQYAGRDLVRASGYLSLADGCDGTRLVSVPLSGAYNGIIVGGPARVGVMVYGSAMLGPNEFIGDFAAAVDLVRLKGRVPVPIPDVELQVGTYVTIESRSVNSVAGVVECDEPTMVELSAQTQQVRGRVWSSGYGYSFIECDGVTPFTLALEGDTRPGPALVYVYAYGYRETETPDYPFPIFEYVWDDLVVEAVNLRR